MSFQGDFRFIFVDVRKQPLKAAEQVRVTIKHSVLAGTLFRGDFAGNATATVRGVAGTAGGLHEVRIESSNYHTVALFLRLRENQITEQQFVLPIKQQRVKAVKFPAYAALPEGLRALLEHSSIKTKTGATLYDALGDLPRAGLLNIYTKLRATKFADGENTAERLLALPRIDRDRSFARVPGRYFVSALETVDAGQWDRVNSSLHQPPAGFETYKRLRGMKTRDEAGNLNLTFFQHPQTEDFVVDIDIDEARGLPHAFHVVAHTITGTKSHPYHIQQILLGAQQLDPGYELIV